LNLIARARRQPRIWHENGPLNPERLEHPARLFDDLFLETLDERNHLALFGVEHLELRKGRRGMTEENAPVALAGSYRSVCRAASS
jgi:hypothetical protein